MHLSNSDATLFAKDFTIKALEHDLITPSVDPKKTAEDIATFYKTLAETLNKEEN